MKTERDKATKWGWQPPEAENGKEGPLPKSLQKELNTLITEFWPPELWENKLLLFEATKFVVICYSSHKKLTQREPPPPKKKNKKKETNPEGKYNF